MLLASLEIRIPFIHVCFVRGLCEIGPVLVVLEKIFKCRRCISAIILEKGVVLHLRIIFIPDCLVPNLG